MDQSRRNFFSKISLFGAGLGASLLANNSVVAQPAEKPAQKALHNHSQVATSTIAKNQIVPVQTPDIAKLPWRMDGNVKVFELTAEVVERELLPASHMGPAKVVDVWGYNGSTPGPTIEVNEGDRVRVIFHNKLPEETTVHWHGLEIPIAMDGTPMISQPMVAPGEKFVYEFTLNQHGTYFYHSHGAMQEMIGLIGMFIIHPKTAHQPAVDKDFGLVLQEWAVLPNSTIPNTLAMEYNWLTLNGKSSPATTPLIVKQGDRVRIRFVNLGMDHHPMHLHGYQFYVTGTEGGRIPESAWYPGNTVIVGVAQARDIEFDAIYPGDWMLHCHLPHHMMNQMVSMVGPMAHPGHGMKTGGGMEEGMGMIRQGNALDEDLGSSFGRGMGTSVSEQSISNLIGQKQNNHQHQHSHSQNQQGNTDTKKRVPGYPQDMMMVMDDEVAKPETYGLPRGWTASMMGMMTLVRVLPPDLYEEVMSRVRDNRTEPKKTEPSQHDQHDQHNQHNHHH